MFRRPVIYVQVERGLFTAKRLGADKFVRRNCAGLDHPRTLMGNFESVAEGFKASFGELCPLLRFYRPKALVHLLPQFEGGYTSVELRAFQEAAAVAGASNIFVSTHDRPQTDSEILEILG